MMSADSTRIWVAMTSTAKAVEVPLPGQLVLTNFFLYFFLDFFSEFCYTIYRKRKEIPKMFEILFGLFLIVFTGWAYDRANERIARKYILVYAAAFVGAIALVIDGAVRWL